MALIGPVLDDRSFEQLKDELVKRIPVYTPTWTDYNETDPGIALLELFAYLGESLLYRFNQIPDATKVAFLRLLGAQPRAAQSAHALLAVATEQPEGVQVLRGIEARADAVSFETEDEVYAWPVDLVGVAKTEAPEITGDERARRTELHRRLDAAAAQDVDDDSPRTYYVVTQLSDDPASAEAVPIDVERSVDQSLWVAILAKSTTDPTAMRGRTLFVGVVMDEAVPATFDLERAPGTGDWASSSLTADPAAVVWEIWQPHATAPLAALSPDRDSTKGMTTTGVVSLPIPGDFPTQVQGETPVGDRTSPPPLDDDTLAARVIAWLRVRRPPTSGDAIHRVRWVGANAVSVVQARTATPELLGTGNASPGQVFRLAQRPAVEGTVRLEVEEADGWAPWQEVTSFASSRDTDRHFRVDVGAGLVEFGERTRAPQLGQRIRVLSYRYGGGVAGNVPVAAISALTGVPSVKVRNVLPAVGGADAASLDDALDAVPGDINRRDRAVVSDDFRALTLEVNGVARADTLPLLHPDTPRQRAAGVVSVVVFPTEDLRNPAAPLPDVSLLRRVAAYLDLRRLVTSELYVIPPTYRKVAVSVGVQVRDGYQVDAVRRWVEQILRQYLAPLPPFGPDGSGWPLGRAVRRAELEAVCAQVEGVEFVVDELLLGTPAEDGTFSTTSLVTLERWDVPELVAIAVVGGSPLPVGTGYDSGSPDDPVLVPLPPDVC